MEDRDLLAAIGEVVVAAAQLEYAVAVLAAVSKGHRGQACEDCAAAMVKNPGGGAMGDLRMRACAQLRGQGMALPQIARMLTVAYKFSVDDEKGPMLPAEQTERSEKAVRDDLGRWDSERPGVVAHTQYDLMALWQSAITVLDDRHVIAHSIVLDSAEIDGDAGLVIFHPRTRVETRLTTPAVLDHAHDIRLAYRRFAQAIAAEASPGP